MVLGTRSCHHSATETSRQTRDEVGKPQLNEKCKMHSAEEGGEGRENGGEGREDRGKEE